MWRRKLVRACRSRRCRGTLERRSCPEQNTLGHLSEFQGERWERWERWDYMRTLDLDNEVKVIDLQAIPTLGVFALFSFLLQQNAASCLTNAGMGCSSLWPSSLGSPSVSLVPRSHFHAALLSSFLFFSPEDLVATHWLFFELLSALMVSNWSDL